MQHKFTGKRISSVVVALPRQSFSFDEECHRYALTPAKARRMKEMMGLGAHRIAPESMTSSDLCAAAALRLLDGGVVSREDIGALVFVSQTPDFFIPPTSNVLQDRLGLGKDVICLDINQGCAGALIGLMQAFLLLEMPSVRKVLVLTGDTASKQVSPDNRASWPLLGDAGCAMVIERADESQEIFMSLKMDGGRHRALMIPAGAYRQPSSQATRVAAYVGDGVVRSAEQIHMDGAAVFAFTMEDVPPQIAEVLAMAGVRCDEVDHFFFHQPNEFMLKQMARKIGVSDGQLPSDIVGIYGNCSSVSVPLVMCHHGRHLQNQKERVCLSGFGVGLSWCTMVMNLGPLDRCEVFDV